MRVLDTNGETGAIFYFTENNCERRCTLPRGIVVPVSPTDTIIPFGQDFSMWNCGESRISVLIAGLRVAFVLILTMFQHTSRIVVQSYEQLGASIYGPNIFIGCQTFVQRF